MLTDSAAILSGETEPAYRTGRPAGRHGLSDREKIEEVSKNKQKWDRLIDDCLIKWGINPESLEDESFIPPNADIIGLACNAAIHLKDIGVDPPDKIVPDGEGGVCFEYEEGSMFASIRIYADKSREILIFDDCKLCERRPL